MQKVELITTNDRCFRRLRGSKRVFCNRDDRVELRVDGLDAIKVRLHNLNRASYQHPRS